MITKAEKKGPSDDNERENVGKGRTEFEDKVFWCVERTNSQMWWVGAAIPLKEEEGHLFSVISGQVDRLNVGSEYGIYNMFSKKSWWE